MVASQSVEERVDASVIVPTHGRAAFLADVLTCLASQELTSPRTYEVIVVDNSPENSRDALLWKRPGWDPRTVYLTEPRVGLHHARHAGARAARGGILVYVDDDVLMDSTWLDAILDGFDDDDVACIGGPVRARWEEGFPPSWLAEVSADYLSLLDYGSKPRNLEPPLCVNGCNLAVRRDALLYAGGFRPDVFSKKRHLWLGGDGEAGMIRCLHQLGFTVRYEPKAAVQHRVTDTRGSRGYARHRARVEGVEHSFIWTREKRPSGVRSLWSSCGCLRHVLKALVRRDDIRCSYWIARTIHQSLVFLSPAFRRYVLRPTWLEPDMWQSGTPR